MNISINPKIADFSDAELISFNSAIFRASSRVITSQFSREAKSGLKSVLTGSEAEIAVKNGFGKEFTLGDSRGEGVAAMAMALVLECPWWGERERDALAFALVLKFPRWGERESALAFALVLKRGSEIIYINLRI